MITLQIRRHSLGAEDEHGNQPDVWASPEPWVVRGMAPGAMAEPFAAGRDGSRVEWTVYADPEDKPDELDRVVVDGAEFEIDGRPKDWTRGPYTTRAGVTVELVRFDG